MSLLRAMDSVSFVVIMLPFHLLLLSACVIYIKKQKNNIKASLRADKHFGANFIHENKFIIDFCKLNDQSTFYEYFMHS